MQLEIKCCQPWKLQILSPQQTGAMPFQRGSPFQTPKEAVHLRVHFPPSQTKRKLNSETLLKLIGCPCTPNKNLCTSSGIFCFSQWVPWLVVVMGSSHQAYRTSRSQPWEVVEKHLEKEKGLIKHDWIVQVFLQIVLYHKYMLYIYIIYMFWMLDNIHDSVTNWFLTHFLGFQCPLMHSKFLCLHDLLDHVHLSSQNACAHKQNMNYCQWQQATKPYFLILGLSTPSRFLHGFSCHVPVAPQAILWIPVSDNFMLTKADGLLEADKCSSRSWHDDMG